MEYIRVFTMIVLIQRIVTRSVVFNYNSNIDSIQEDIHTFMEDTEDMDTGVRLFLEGFKQNIENGREEIKKIENNFEEDTSRSLRIFQRFLSNVEEEEKPKNEVEIIKMWKLEDIL